MNKFWNFKANGKNAELFIYGEISIMTWFGDEVTPTIFQKELAALGEVDTIDVYINSPGGDAFAGITIYNMLKRHKAKIITHNDGLAASAASIVFESGDVRICASNSVTMVHFAWSCSCGNKSELRKLADVLETIDEQLVQIYSDRTGLDADEVRAMLEAETWMSGDEAKEKGFADEIEENKKVAACAEKEILARYKHPPESVKTEEQSEQPPEGGISLPEEPNNGDASQPVEDKTAALAAQKDRFLRTKIKQYGGN